MRSRAIALVVMLHVAGAAVASGQTPQPFPRPGQTTPATRPAPPAAPAQPVQQRVADASGAPSEELLGAPIYPAAQFITSYDAGRGQRFYLFGVTAPYADMVQYYRTALKQRGSELFESPPTHQFEVGRFREESMAFPPSVTIKDYTWGGSGGYPNPKSGAPPQRFPTIIQIVPAPAGTPQ